MRVPLRYFALFAGLAAGGCFARMGPKPAKLDATKATAVDLILVGGGSTFCVHGDPVQLKAVVTLEDGKKLETWSRGSKRDGKLEFAAFEWSSSFGAVGPQGQLRAGGDPFAVMEREVALSVTVAGRPDLVSELTVKPSFGCNAVAGFSGLPGRAGRGGSPGRQGRNGDSGHSSKQATDAENGSPGRDGGDGTAGGNGPRVEVALTYIDSKAHGRLVLARVGRVGGRQGYLMVDPRSGKKITVLARGGAGGSGGSGGQGGAGGFGGSNNIVDGGDGGNGGDGADGGNGGDGADGGDGGSVTVKFDRRYPELKGMVIVSTAGGSAGLAGRGGFGGTPGPGGSSASGTRGAGGRAGIAGESGSNGRSGRSGPPARYAPANAKRLFAAELGRGIHIVTR